VHELEQQPHIALRTADTLYRLRLWTSPVPIMASPGRVMDVSHLRLRFHSEVDTDTVEGRAHVAVDNGMTEEDAKVGGSESGVRGDVMLDGDTVIEILHHLKVLAAYDFARAHTHTLART
jgi:hypothetical protein